MQSLLRFFSVKSVLSVYIRVFLRSFFVIALGFASAADYPWTGAAPQEVVESALLPDRVFDETPGDWRPVLEPIMAPVAASCGSAREAVLAIASHMTELTGVSYSPERRQPCMSPLEALAEKKVSCTGQSILLICALRSVGIPARAVGVFTWGHIRGNHTWVEAWFDGGWHMIEFNEKDFNTPWVMENIGMLNPKDPAQRVWALCGSAKDGAFFPAVWNPALRLPAEDVTERYMALSRDWYARSGLPANCQRLMLDCNPRPTERTEIQLLDAAGQVVDSAPLPTAADDFRKFATLSLPREGEFYLALPGSPVRIPIQATEPPVHLLQLHR